MSNNANVTSDTMTTNSNAVRMVSNPVEFFEGSFTKMQSMPWEYVSTLQIEALQWRFEQLRDNVSYLKKLADKQHIDELKSVDDVIPLLFEHTVAKAYPTSLIDNNRFNQLTQWLGKFTSHDLSGLDVSGCKGLDDWFRLLDEKTPLTVCHSAGTTGSLSLLPWSKDEWNKLGETHSALLLQQFGDDADCRQHQGIDVIYPYFRRGSLSHMRANEQVVRHIAKGEERYHCAFPQRISSDVLYFAGRIHSAKAKGQLSTLEVDPDLLKRKEEFDRIQADMPKLLEEFFDKILVKLKGKRVFMMSTWNIVYNMAMAGLNKGMSHVFSSDSILSSGGGAKGMTPPEDWKERVMEFMGITKIGGGYGMSEVFLTAVMCEHNHYHLNPWIIPFVLDPDTSKPLPRSGVQTGRAAFFDLAAESHWGGFISGDEVTLHWDANCPCGRKTPYYEDNIGRYSDKRGGDDKITCAATADAHKEAMEYLAELDG